MYYYEVLIADNAYKGEAPLTYASEESLEKFTVVSVPLKKKFVTGYVLNQASKPQFAVKPVRTKLSDRTLPPHCIDLAKWISDYYATDFGEALRLFAPTSTVLRRAKATGAHPEAANSTLDLDAKLSKEQQDAIKIIKGYGGTTMLLHGETGSGKTRVYLELAKSTLDSGKSVIFLVPEIALTAHLVNNVAEKIQRETIVLHSEMSPAQRKKIWFKILESDAPMLIIGPRSALFAPLHNLGLIVIDEEHEPAYKQEQSPRYHAVRAASQLGALTSSRVILGSATPSITDYYLANERHAVVTMNAQALTGKRMSVKKELVDIKDRNHFKKNSYISDDLIGAVNETLKNNKQVMLFYNRRGSARLILCGQCGWQLTCPHCDIPLVYHQDQHSARCHICGHSQTPPNNCPECGNSDVIYKSIGSKALEDIVSKLFPAANVARYDSDNVEGERLDQNYQDVISGKVDILVGTQLLAKGLDLPRLGLVGVVTAETSLTLPDYSSEERTFQLLYQVIGRVGRGHSEGKVVVQAYDPESLIVEAAMERDWGKFYEYAIKERQNYRFPPFSYLMKLVCRRSTPNGAEKAAMRLRNELLAQHLPVEIVGPTPSFYSRRGKFYYFQIVVKSKERGHLLKLAAQVPDGWAIDLDPANLL